MTCPDEVESLIVDAPLSAHLGTSVDDRPHVAPVWYGYREGVVYCLTGGRKLENLRRNPRVSLSIEQASEEDVEWNVTLLGRANVVDDAARMAWADGWIYDKYDADSGEDDEAVADGGVEEGNSALVEITITDAAWNVY